MIFAGLHQMFICQAYKHPAKRYLFDMEFDKTSHGQAGPFADCEDPKAVEDYEWPSVEDLDLSQQSKVCTHLKILIEPAGFGPLFITM